jgi:hypothetical protein
MQLWTYCPKESLGSLTDRSQLAERGFLNIVELKLCKNLIIRETSSSRSVATKLRQSCCCKYVGMRDATFNWCRRRPRKLMSSRGHEFRRSSNFVQSHSNTLVWANEQQQEYLRGLKYLHICGILLIIFPVSKPLTLMSPPTVKGWWLANDK